MPRFRCRKKVYVTVSINQITVIDYESYPFYLVPLYIFILVASEPLLEMITWIMSTHEPRMNISNVTKILFCAQLFSGTS